MRSSDAKTAKSFQDVFPNTEIHRKIPHRHMGNFSYTEYAVRDGIIVNRDITGTVKTKLGTVRR